MCRWGCGTTDTTYMCKWCGTRYCRECLRGDFCGVMTESSKCRQCFQKRCQGPRVEYVPGQKKKAEDKGRGTSARRPASEAGSAKKSVKKGKTKKKH